MVSGGCLFLLFGVWGGRKGGNVLGVLIVDDFCVRKNVRVKRIAILNCV